MSETKILAAIAIILLVVLIFSIFCIRKIVQWTKLLDKKNIRLIQLYLDMKFLYKNLFLGAVTKDSALFCTKLMSLIKEYYNLREVLIIDLDKFDFQTYDVNILKTAVYAFLCENKKDIDDTIRRKNILIQNMETPQENYMLYIFSLNQKYRHFVICIGNNEVLIKENELLGLESNINLLKIRLS